jgi:hypothetical protein
MDEMSQNFIPCFCSLSEILEDALWEGIYGTVRKIQKDFEYLMKQI